MFAPFVLLPQSSSSFLNNDFALSFLSPLCFFQALEKQKKKNLVDTPPRFVEGIKGKRSCQFSSLQQMQT
jgi:hypothetical protein